MQLPQRCSFPIVLLLFTVVLITGCKKNYAVSEKQVIMFQLDYLNYSLGYQHKGFLIDHEGNILTYNNPRVWNFPDKNFSISKGQVEENVGKCTLSGIKIPEEELHKYSNYIKNIASSKVTAMKNVAADAGSLQFICYQLYESSGNYKGHLIKMEGDFTCENLNFFSKKTAAWMRDINNTLNQK